MSQLTDVVHFESRLRSAMERARVVLESAKAPCFTGNVHHRYEDKYLLAEYLTNAAAASQLNSLAGLGVGPEQLAQLRRWADGSAVSLRFRAEERCTFLREVTREVESPTTEQTSLSIGGVVRAALTRKSVTKVTEYFWRLDVSYTLLAVRGVGEQPSDRLQLAARAGNGELKTAANFTPRPEAKIPAVEHEVPALWLLKHLQAEDTTPCFRVDRGHERCHTPRRNPAVEAAADHFKRVASWAARVASYLEGLFRIQVEGVGQYDGAASQDVALIPVLPLMLGEADADDGGTACVLGPAEANQLLAEETRGMAARRAELAQIFADGEGVATLAEALLVSELRHCASVCRQWTDALDYVECLLRKQLIAAIGKEVTPVDFAEYMRFHNRKVFAQAFAPAPFCFAVRRSGQHAPEGTVSIEQLAAHEEGDGHVPEPIFTLAARSARPHVMELPLSASTSVRFGGERYLHAWVSHKFSGEAAERLALVSRARQFSSMIVLVGRVASATAFEAKYAAIVKNKDELTIPLELSTIPTPKEFKDAIESLSPEQQTFAKAFRSMQLESTLFGVLIVQIKPQLEKVLNLNPDSLTKEIKLTQELMQLFVTHQIPSDLLSYAEDAGDGQAAGSATAAGRLEAVRGHVKAMNEMIHASKEEELAARKAEAQWKAAEEANMRRRLQEAEELSRCRLLEDEGAPVLRSARKMRSRRSSGAPVAAAAAAAAPPAANSAAVAGPQPPPPQSVALPPPSQQPASLQPAPKPAEDAEAAPTERPEEEGPEVDYTKLPLELDRRFEKLDVDGALRPTIISAGMSWTKRAQRALLASPEVQTLGSTEQKSERDAAFDLLDALTKSGALQVDHASLHIVVAATHCFDKTVIDTVVQDNVSPIDKVERSLLIMASTVHGRPPAALLREAQRLRVQAASPGLFLEDL